jgi:hypothetical protein
VPAQPRGPRGPQGQERRRPAPGEARPGGDATGRRRLGRERKGGSGDAGPCGIREGGEAATRGQHPLHRAGRETEAGLGLLSSAHPGPAELSGTETSAQSRALTPQLGGSARRPNHFLPAPLPPRPHAREPGGRAQGRDGTATLPVPPPPSRNQLPPRPPAGEQVQRGTGSCRPGRSRDGARWALLGTGSWEALWGTLGPGGSPPSPSLHLLFVSQARLTLALQCPSSHQTTRPNPRVVKPGTPVLN